MKADGSKYTDKEINKIADKLEQAIQNNNITIQYGDTLSQIAKEYRTTVRSIANLNRIEDPNKIIEGMPLEVFLNFELVSNEMIKEFGLPQQFLNDGKDNDLNRYAQIMIHGATSCRGYDAETLNTREGVEKFVRMLDENLIISENGVASKKYASLAYSPEVEPSGAWEVCIDENGLVHETHIFENQTLEASGRILENGRIESISEKIRTSNTDMGYDFENMTTAEILEIMDIPDKEWDTITYKNYEGIKNLTNAYDERDISIENISKARNGLEDTLKEPTQNQKDEAKKEGVDR